LPRLGWEPVDVFGKAAEIIAAYRHRVRARFKNKGDTDCRRPPADAGGRRL